MYTRHRLPALLVCLLSLGFSSLVAQCLQGNCQQGTGTYRFDSGATFQGQFENGRLVNGIYTYSSGAVYRGDFQNNQRHGQGTYIGTSGKRFVGQFERGEMTFGSMYFTNGSVYTGQFQGGQFGGQGRLVTEAGNVYEGQWSGGELVAEGAAPSPPSGSGNSERTFAVCVGVADYINFGPGSGDLNYCNSDAERFDIFLRSGRMSGSDPRLTFTSVLTDREATKANILQEMRRLFSQADENDKVIFFFSGHGDRMVFLPADASSSSTSMLTHADVKEVFKLSRAGTKLIFADACYSGSIQQRPSSNGGSNQGGNRDADVAVMLSSTGSQISFEHPSLRQGVFAYFLIEGLNGNADRNGDRIVTIEEVFYYVHARSTSFTRERFGQEQTPYLFGRFDRQMPLASIR